MSWRHLDIHVTNRHYNTGPYYVTLLAYNTDICAYITYGVVSSIHDSPIAGFPVIRAACVADLLPLRSDTLALLAA